MLSLYFAEDVLQGLHFLLALAVYLLEFLVLGLQPLQPLLLPHIRHVALRVHPAEFRRRHWKEREPFLV
jgi:hypothetical protein